MAMEFKPGAKQRAILLAKGLESGDTEIIAEDVNKPSLRVCLTQAGQIAQVSPVSSDGMSTTTVALLTGGFLYLFNGSSWDRFYNNQEVILLESAKRTSSTSSSIQVNRNARGGSAKP